ncbi:hypothetical protein BTT_64300 (plasmid) [Bacillus thuringiensis serovar morrisoni str. 4AA1]|nr:MULTISPECIES: hypothetical protein [Bacillus]AJQ62749.1 hypothetical protein SD98_31385 [Bacillus thuringiensis serovar morrisoni]MED3102245.1 hypothetical protein [Bacillus thuringiensis]MRA99434.1 hypothetical protein [Bacillus thuringiensis]OTY44122.1 hypothetical protein BK736_05510 [Bacillus thuringiensis serovar poloniensis]RNG17968.1 hypothetical protein EEL55_30870 [Bacillus thuringiensis]
MDIKDYSIKKYRVRPEAMKLIKYLNWKETSQKEEDKFFLDKIVNTYFSQILAGQIIIQKEKISGRKDRSLLLKNDTHQLIDKKHSKAKCTMGETIEISLFIYAQENLTSEELKMNDLNAWNITYRRVRK